MRVRSPFVPNAPKAGKPRLDSLRQSCTPKIPHTTKRVMRTSSQRGQRLQAPVMSFRRVRVPEAGGRKLKEVTQRRRLCRHCCRGEAQGTQTCARTKSRCKDHGGRSLAGAYPTGMRESPPDSRGVEECVELSGFDGSDSSVGRQTAANESIPAAPHLVLRACRVYRPL